MHKNMKEKENFTNRKKKERKSSFKWFLTFSNTKDIHQENRKSPDIVGER